MKIKISDILPLAGNLLKYLQEVVDHITSLKASGIDIDEDLLAAYLDSKMIDWKPKIKGKLILDDDSRLACARFLSGIAFNLFKD